MATHAVHLYARAVSAPQKKEIFCFKINQEAQIIQVHSMNNPRMLIPLSQLTPQLFELTSIEAHDDDAQALTVLRERLTQTGIDLLAPAHACDVSMLYKPLGHIEDTIRFTLDTEGRITFLSPKRPLEVYNNPLNRIKPLPHQLT